MNRKERLTFQDITVKQAERLLPAVEQVHAFYERLLRRMEQRGFDSADAYYLRVEAALQHTHTVMIWTFYATVKQGVGIRERKDT